MNLIKRIAYHGVKWTLIAMLLSVTLLPALAFAFLSLGPVPIMGNLYAGAAITRYIAQYAPAWEPDRLWADWNPLANGYYLSASQGDDTLTFFFCDGRIFTE